jgi:acetyl-CoA carboxylase carboxyl transferase subunit beta
LSERPSARERIVALTRSFDEHDAELVGGNPLRFEGYEVQLERARMDTALDDACVWGFAEIEDQRCALMVFDFAFMGGSMGVVVGEKVARAFDAAVRERLPVVTVTSSGGARMQEGMWALVQMAKTVEAHQRHAAAGLVHVTLLTSPTTGGVYASFASLADVIYAEPEATVGFAGPRVVEELTGAAPASDVHTAEFAFAHGLVDALVPLEAHAPTIARTLRALAAQHRPALSAKAAGPLTGALTHPTHRVMSGEPLMTPAWHRLEQVRSARWPKAREILDVLVSDAVELRGDRVGGPDDPHVVVRVGRLAGYDVNVVAMAQDASGDGRIRAEGFRKAVRAIALGSRLGLPVVTVIDTRGADPLPASEAAGVAAAIARTFEAMLACTSPTVAVVTGEGGSGGALAMAVADRVIAWESAVFSVIAPEAAAAILYRDPSRGPELADRLRITSTDLVSLGLVDHVVPEPAGGVLADPQAAMQILASGVAEQVESLMALTLRRRLRQREKRWRSIARPSAGSRRGRSNK